MLLRKLEELMREVGGRAEVLALVLELPVDPAIACHVAGKLANIARPQRHCSYRVTEGLLVGHTESFGAVDYGLHVFKNVKNNSIYWWY